MHDKVFSCTVDGFTPKIIEVETDIQNGLPTFSIVGLGDASVQEAKERVRSALKNSRASFPPLRKTVNLAPANIRKHGPSFDLPIAVSILSASSQIPKIGLEKSIFIGELALDGTLRRVRGVLPITAHAARNGFKKIYLPEENAYEASLVPNVEIMPVKNLYELTQHFYTGNTISPYTSKNINIQEDCDDNINDFKYIRGMDREKRAMEIAASGRHHVLMSGPPGCGKTLLARIFHTILPPLSKEESLEVTAIYSVAGLLPSSLPLIVKRPFREVHSSATEIAVLGGGANITPGEITLGHKGAVFFDELSEFPTKTLEILKKPLEDGYISIQRSSEKLTLPADFIFIGAMNPCPCGFYGDAKKECKCSFSDIKRHSKKLSGPLMDRIDIVISMRRIKFKEFDSNVGRESSKEVRERVGKATEIQFKRQGKENSKLKSQEIKRYCALGAGPKEILKTAVYKLGISTRGLIRVLKLARTIADLAGTASIQAEHLAEALQYRAFKEPVG